jgi:predicted metal-dependent enzyme (double-stranded beta helix superfamily)
MTLDDFCHRFQTLMDGKPPLRSLIEEGRLLVGELAGDAEWLRETLERLIMDRQYLDSQKATIWPNEVALYRSPDQSFVVLSYLWEPRAADIIHDHGSWGIIGEVISPSLERKYRRLDDSSRDGYAELEEISSRVIEPGDTTYVLPLNEGLHQMVNCTDSIAVSVNVYGKVIRKGYVQFFYPEKKSVQRVYPPKTFKGVMAIRTLGILDRPWAEDILRAALRSPLPEMLKRECEISLSMKGCGEERK